MKIVCSRCLGTKGSGSIVDGWTSCEQCDGRGEIETDVPDSHYSVTVRWSADEQLHVFVVTCDQCGEESTFKVGNNYNAPSQSQVNWMINHRWHHQSLPTTGVSA